TEAQRLKTAAHAEREDFDRCAEKILERFDASSKEPGSEVWIAYAFGAGDVIDGVARGMPAGIEPVVAWDTEPRIATLLALADGVEGTLVLADHLQAAFFSVQGDDLTEVTRFETHAKI